jgi:hypothetical protein
MLDIIKEEDLIYKSESEEYPWNDPVIQDINKNLIARKKEEELEKLNEGKSSIKLTQNQFMLEGSPSVYEYWDYKDLLWLANKHTDLDISMLLSNTEQRRELIYRELMKNDWNKIQKGIMMKCIEKEGIDLEKDLILTDKQFRISTSPNIYTYWGGKEYKAFAERIGMDVTGIKSVRKSLKKEILMNAFDSDLTDEEFEFVELHCEKEGIEYK